MKIFEEKVNFIENLWSDHIQIEILIYSFYRRKRFPEIFRCCRLNPFSTSVLYKVRFFRVLYFFNNALTQKDIEVRFALKHKEDFCGCNYVRIVTIMRSLRCKIWWLLDTSSLSRERIIFFLKSLKDFNFLNWNEVRSDPQ